MWLFNYLISDYLMHFDSLFAEISVHLISALAGFILVLLFHEGIGV